MASNPLNAFLQGFRVVDNLERNRDYRESLAQDREFQAEKQSRLREMWKREDEEWARVELERYRTQKFAEFEAEVSDVINNVPEDQINTWFSNEASKDGKPAGMTLVINEALKRMIAKDPEFGEHAAQAFGIDPSAGPLTVAGRGGTPVIGMGVLPSTLDPSGKGGVFFQVDSVNGPQPLTRNRSSRGDDPVFLGQIGMKELVGVFGPQALNSQSALTQQLLTAAGLERPTGNPFESQDRVAATAPAPGLLERQILDDSEPQQSDGTSSAPGLLERQILDDSELQQPATPATSAAEAGQNFGEISKARLAVVQGLFGGNVNDPNPISQAAADSEIGQAVGRGADAIRSAAVTASRNTRDFIGGFVDGLLGRPGEDRTPVTNRPSNSLADIRDTGAAPSTYRPQTVATSNEAAQTAIESASAPSDGAAREIAARITQPRARRSPSVVDVYNAAGLAKMGIITPDELRRFAQTGQFDPPAENKMKAVTSDGYALFYNDQGPVARMPIAPQGASTGDADDTLKTREGIFDFIEKQVENEFVDNDNNVSKRALGEFMNIEEDLSNLLGVDQADPRRTDSTYLNALAKGTRFVQRFDEDDVQFIDLWPGDFEIPVNAKTAAVGTVLAQQGIANQEEATYGLRTYLEELEPVARRLGLSDSQFIAAVQRAETDVVEAAKTSRKKRRKLREEIVEDLIKSAAN